MVPQNMHFGTSLRNGAMNSSFLVLNLGTNTFGVGSSCTSSTSQGTFHPITVPGHVNASMAKNAPSASNSAKEGSAILHSRKRKDVSEEKEDPDWVLEKKVKKSSNTSGRRKIVKPGQLAAKSPSEMLQGGGNVATLSRTGAPPQYLVSLLNFFGWKVVFRPGFGDYIYVSPAGLAYFSLPKAFETFLNDSSKYKEKSWTPSQFSRNGSLNGISEPVASVLGRNLGQQSGASANGSNEEDKLMTKSFGIENSTDAVMPSECLQQPKQDHVYENFNSTTQLLHKVVSQGANSEVSLFRQTGERAGLRGGNNGHFSKQLAPTSLDEENVSAFVSDLQEEGRYPRTRWPLQSSGPSVPVEREKDGSSASCNNSYASVCGASACGACGDATREKEKREPATSVARIPEISGSFIEDRALHNEQIKSTWSIDRNPRNITHSDNVMFGLRRSKRIAELDAERVQRNYFDSTNSVPCRASIEKEVSPMIPATLLDEKMHSRLNDGCKNDESKMLDCTKVVHIEKDQSKSIVMNGCSSLEIRRSRRINGNHVRVGDDFHVDVGTADDLTDCAELTASRATQKDKVRLKASFFDIPYMEGGSPSLDIMQLKQISVGSSQNHMVETPYSERCSPSLAVRRKLIDVGNSSGEKQKNRTRGCGLVVRRNGKDNIHEKFLSQTKLSIFSWLIDAGTLAEDENVVYVTKSNSRNLHTGLITRGGVWCNCCQEVVQLLGFEAHAGSNLHQPWDHVFLFSGKSLMQCLKEAWENEKKQRNIFYKRVGLADPDPSDDTCGVCADGGHLICCDSCPSTFHQECVMLKSLPEGSWYCPYCRCAFCTAAHHGSQGESEALTLLRCKQCGRKYHQECAWANDTEEMNSVPLFFCAKNCNKVAACLSALLGARNPMEGGFSWTLLKRLDEEEGLGSDRKHSLILECNAKLCLALSVLDECFVPLVDQRTDVDMISQAVFNCGSNFNRLSYEGFYTMILEKNEEIISVASLRFHGTHLAEMPFIGTRPSYQNQGMCRRLLKAIEDMLSSLSIERLIIPAISDLLDTWMKSFKFKSLESSVKDEIRNRSLVIFAETTLLQKNIQTLGALDQEDDMQTDNGCHWKGMQGMHESASPEAHNNTGDHSVGDQGFWAHGYSNIGGEKETFSDPNRMIEDSSFTSDLVAIVHPGMSNELVSEAFPARSTAAPNRVAPFLYLH